MNVHTWNRKDALPYESIEKFGQTLNSLGIECCVVQEESYKDHWYSNRIEIKGLPTIGTNGKGVTPEYTMASAMGEFFERLQCGMLVKYLYPLKRKEISISHETEHATYGFRKFFPEVWQSLGGENAYKMVLENAMNGGVCICEDIFTGAKYTLPENLLTVLCGANGTAAGNTYAEAFVQGVSELFERYVTQFIFKEEYEDVFKEIEEQAYGSLNSYRLIQAIEDRRYHVRVIDCSLGGRLPVIGVLILDPSMTKYYFKLGADADVDIALQRCITEIFQGTSFDINFRMLMKECYASDIKEEGFWYGSNRVYDHIRAEIDGTGRLPRAFFRSIENKTDTISGFCDDVVTNDVAVGFMLGRCKLIADTVGLINYTKYGVPCIRIIMPDICASLYYPTDRGTSLFQTIKATHLFRTAVAEGKLLTKDALNYILDILGYPAYTYEFSMTKLLGIITDDITDAPYLYNPYLFTSYLALYLKEYDIAAKYMEIYNKNARVNEVIRHVDDVVIKAFMENVQDDEVVQFFSGFGENEKIMAEVNALIDIHKNGFQVPSCPDCKICALKGICHYHIWKEIEDCMLKYVPNSMNDKFETFILQCRGAAL